MTAGSRSDPEPKSRSFVSVAVPLPLPELTYGIPAGLRGEVQAGCRLRVPVGARQVVGFATALTGKPPEDVPEAKIKDVLELLDREPVLPAELIELGRFASDYYLAPLGETLRTMVPTDLPPWGDRRVSLTDAGAVAPMSDPCQAAIRNHLLLQGRMRLAELQGSLGIPGLSRHVETMRREGRVSVEDPAARGMRWVRAVELSPGDIDALLGEVGRSKKGREVVEYLKAVERPVAVRDVAGTVGCGKGVIRRLVKLGVLREFSQPARLSLERHRMQLAEEREEFVLRTDQENAVEALNGAIGNRQYSPFLIHGMTGSGKTEVYLRATARCLELGRSVIVMVPEIALVPSLASELRARFGAELAILHSNLSNAERQQEWERIRRGEARVVLGPRSALWAPVADLGFIVVDEEHEGAYKQDKAPRYNGRDLALWRARRHGATAALVSATPSLESRRNTQTGKLGFLELTARAGRAQLPEGILVDLRKEKGSEETGELYFSGVLQAEIRRALTAGDQIVLLRNRRGYAPVLLCRACGEDFQCPDCGLPMTYHLRGHRLECHYCGHGAPAPLSCPACSEAALEPIGAGTERVEERFKELFPDAEADVLDADSARRTGGAAAVLERFGRGKSQVLIGTQMVAKGHHFPRVSLAAVLFADTYLRFPDFRAVERTYSLLTQLAGRAGRGERPGRVVIQTYQPDHYAIRSALAHDDRAFAVEEMRYRRTFHYPPFTRMVAILAQDKENQRAESALRRLADALSRDRLVQETRILGPTPAPMERLRGKWRWQMILRGPSSVRLRRSVEAALEGLQPATRQLLTVDVDPYDLL
ncbi:MAG: primosomal protein N' [Thermoanaerobaculia bacterium]|nr:primosomal protein N' [Thermoanaerobaculia bacterium]